MLRKLLVVCSILSLSAACSPITRETVIQQPIGAILTAGPGDVIVKAAKQRDLENVFGRADLYGRKTNEGYAELTYVGIGSGESILFIRKDVDILTNETTMSRTPTASAVTTSAASGSAYATGNYISGSGQGTSVTTATLPASDFHAVMPARSLAIALEPATTELPFEGHIVTIIKAAPHMLTYRVEHRADNKLP